jgi:hypothetical protein
MSPLGKNSASAHAAYLNVQDFCYFISYWRCHYVIFNRIKASKNI